MSAMSGFWKVFEGIKGFYNGINPATLTGAIDVVIIQNADGTYSSSPFHVRFGKLGVLRSKEKVVDIEINGEASDLQMKLGDAGEAFFVNEVEVDEEEQEDFPAHLATSPIPNADAMEQMFKGVKELHSLSDLKENLIEVPPESILTVAKEMKSDSSWDGQKVQRPRRKVLTKKKKRGLGGNQRSVSMPENVADHDQEGVFAMDSEFSSGNESSEDEEVALHFPELRSSSSPQIKDMAELTGTTSHRRMSSIGNGSMLTPFSDPESSPITSPVASRPATPKSDTEVDKQHTEENQTSALLEHSATWQWGEFPVSAEENARQATADAIVTVSTEEGEKTQSVINAQTSKGFMSIWGGSRTESEKKSNTFSEGVYLADLEKFDDPEMASIYLGGRPREHEEDNESGRGQSLPQSPNSVEGSIGGPVSFTMSEVKHLGPVSLSLCGGLGDPEGVSLDKFMQKVVTFEDLAEQPNLISHPELVVKIHDKFYNWITASPMVLSQIVFHKQLPEQSVKTLEKEHMPKKEKKKSSRGWFSWGRSADIDDVEIGAGEKGEATASSSTVTLTSENVALTSDSQPPSTESSATNTPRKHRPRRNISEGTSTETEDTDASEKEVSKTPPTPTKVISSTSEESEVSHPTPTPHSSATPVPIETDSELPDLTQKSKKTIFKKTLRLTTEQVIKSKLKPGHNELVFSVTTQYQGTTRCVSHVYLWRHTDKIVISDIDGTITKSDVIGQIAPILGRDWSQSGVADLFTRINKNGYKLIYLSARAIGQARSTKDMLKSIRQGNLVLPDGPIFLNPTSLFSAFHREVIVKNPEEFKINCLKDISELFPSCPFYAGFGNKFNDVIAYRALSIPNSHIFTINPQGQLRHDLSLTFLSSYSGMSDIVDHFFPCLDKVDLDTSHEYNPVNYWRDPIPKLSDDELIRISETALQTEKEK